MAFEKGKTGNAGGRPKEKAFADAVRVAVNRVDEADPEKRKRLMVLADKLIQCAMNGEGWAMQQIGDRLDGKPAQAIDATITDERDLSELSTAELLARTARILAQAEAGDRGAGEGENPPSDVRQLN